MNTEYKICKLFDSNEEKYFQAVNRLSDGAWMIESEGNGVFEEELPEGFEIIEEIGYDELSSSYLRDFYHDYEPYED